jgi:hypothetical protein
MTTHDEALHPRDTASGEFAAKNQTDPELYIEAPEMHSSDIELERLEGEYSRVPDHDGVADNQRKIVNLASQILTIRVYQLKLDGKAHHLILSDETDEGAPYWWPKQIRDADGKVLWQIGDPHPLTAEGADAADDGVAEWLGEYTPSLDRTGEAAVTLPDGQPGIIL